MIKKLCSLHIIKDFPTTLYHGSNSVFMNGLSLNKYKILWLTDDIEAAKRYAISAYYRKETPFIYKIELSPSAKQIDLRDLSNPRVQKLRADLNNVRRYTIGHQVSKADWETWADYGMIEAHPWIRKQLLKEGYAGAWVKDYVSPEEHNSFALFNLKWIQKQEKLPV